MTGYILRESTGCCLQDPDRKIYKSKNCQKRLKQLFLELLKESEYLDRDIAKVKEELNEDDYYETKYCCCNGNEAWVDFKDLYSTRTYLSIVY